MGNNQNYIEKIETEEIKGLIPYLNKEEIYLLLSNLDPLLKSNGEKLNEEDRPKINIDLEQLQIAHYPSLVTDDEVKRELVNIIQECGIYYQEDLDFLALNSLFTITWPEPKNTQDLIRIAEIETKFHLTLVSFAKHIGAKYINRTDWLPYWGRLAQFNVIRSLPENLQKKYSPKNIPCILVRSKDVNAHTFPLVDTFGIALDYSLEPFLKSMNTLLISYFKSEHMSGPKRFERAFSEVLPRVMFFKGLLSARFLTPYSLLFSQQDSIAVKNITEDQIQFLIAHEYGHIILEHHGKRNAFPNSFNTLSDKSVDHIEYEHSMEYEADIFALEFFRSRALNYLRYQLHPKRAENEETSVKTLQSAQSMILDYGGLSINIQLLFQTIQFIESLYDSISGKLPHLSWQKPSKFHPNPIDRLDRIKKHLVFDLPIKDSICGYADNFFNQVLIYCNSLEKEKLHSLVESFKIHDNEEN